MTSRHGTPLIVVILSWADSRLASSTAVLVVHYHAYAHIYIVCHFSSWQ